MRGKTANSREADSTGLSCGSCPRPARDTSSAVRECVKKSTIPTLCFFAIIVVVADWPRPFPFAVRVQTAVVPLLDLATTGFVGELHRLGLQRAPNEEKFAAGLMELIVDSELSGPVRTATLSAFGIEETKAAQSVWLRRKTVLVGDVHWTEKLCRLSPLTDPKSLSSPMSRRLPSRTVRHDLRPW